MKGKNKVIDVSEYIINLGFAAERPLSNISIQKILYFIQGFHLATNEDVLFNEKIYAWEYGPVVKEVYDTYKVYGNNFILPINNFENKYYGLFGQRTFANLDRIAEDQKEFVFSIWNLFKDYAPFELVQITHANGSPWHELYKKYNGSIPKNTVIDTGDMKSYFKTLL